MLFHCVKITKVIHVKKYSHMQYCLACRIKLKDEAKFHRNERRHMLIRSNRIIYFHCTICHEILYDTIFSYNTCKSCIESKITNRKNIKTGKSEFPFYG